MANFLPLIVGFGGYNAAGRSSGYRSYERMILESLAADQRQQTVESLSHLMGIPGADEQQVLDGTLVRQVESGFFNVNNTPQGKRITLQADEQKPAKFVIAGKDLPHPLPDHWTAEPLDEGGKRYQILIDSDQTLTLSCTSKMPVQAAGQLPSGFNPGSHYRSQNHPRGLQMSILAASDAVKSMGVDWQEAARHVSPDAIAVYSSSVMTQLDSTGFGGMMQARQLATRVTSKQLAMGLNTMPADFVNAYVLGSVGATGGITGACATFLYNLRQGVDEIRSGRRKIVVVGASEAPIIPEVMDGYSAMSALATDADLLKLDGLHSSETPNHRRASRPFGENCGFTLAESSQFVVLMADDLAIKLGAQVYGAVPGVYVNADGHKKSISAPGAGNYITMAKAVALARTLLGDDALRQRSFVHAHGSSTPQNRITESRIFDEVAKAFGIESWPVAAVKSYLGHSLGPASGDQLVASLGTFAYGYVPGIKTIDSVASDVYADRLQISKTDIEMGVEGCDIAFLNSKGFGGNNATATVLSPRVLEGFLSKRYSNVQMRAFRQRQEQSAQVAANYQAKADKAQLEPIYAFGTDLIDEDSIIISHNSISLPGYEQPITLGDDEGFSF
ncbi:beta-ketoacyl synthase [Teredinibacter haidensis]|uniref:beta-ketoacyl synthase n=1 Tax=Teredinibacter haidensis TaxID=2731755 RepID=UPI000948EDC8|nr:beta-ketoacyl synthase [Teredinibacter haidensis]